MAISKRIPTKGKPQKSKSVKKKTAAPRLGQMAQKRARE